MSASGGSDNGGNLENCSRPLSFLEARQVQMIDEALSSLGEFGEIRLIVEKGRLRFLVTQRSVDILKWQPGSLKGGSR